MMSWWLRSRGGPGDISLVKWLDGIQARLEGKTIPLVPNCCCMWVWHWEGKLTGWLPGYKFTYRNCLTSTPLTRMVKINIRKNLTSKFCIIWANFALLGLNFHLSQILQNDVKLTKIFELLKLGVNNYSNILQSC